MGRGKSGAGGGGSSDKLNNLKNIDIAENMLNNPKYEQPLAILNDLTEEYNTRLGAIKTGAEKAAGDVDMSGYTLRINTNDAAISIHEFAHTLANSSADKYGLTNDKDFWKEIRKVRNEYHRDVDRKQDSKRWISQYEHSSGSIDEFFADAFTHAKLKQMGLTTRQSYGSDYTYSDKVLAITDKYFRKIKKR